MLLLQITDIMPVSTELPALISTSALSVAIIQWFKNSDLPIFKMFNQQSAGLNRLVAWIAAIISGVGIHYQYDATVGSLTITGLTAAALWHTGMDSAKSYAFNWLIYNTAIKNRQNQAPTPPVPPQLAPAPEVKGTV